MLAQEVVKVEVKEWDIIQANEDFCPITNAVSHALEVDADKLEINHNRVFVFDDYDIKQAVYIYSEGKDIVKSFLDSWQRHLCGCEENFEQFEFELAKRK